MTNNVELTIDMSNTMDGGTRALSKEEVLLCLERLVDFITVGGKNATWPPQ